MIKLKIISVKTQSYKGKEGSFQVLTLELPDGDTIKVTNFSEKLAKTGGTAILGIVFDNKTGLNVVRLQDIA